MTDNERIPEDWQCGFKMAVCYTFVGVTVSLLMVVAAPFVFLWALTAPARWVYWHWIGPTVNRMTTAIAATCRGLADGSWFYTLYQLGQPDNAAATHTPNREEGEDA